MININGWTIMASEDQYQQQQFWNKKMATIEDYYVMINDVMPEINKQFSINYIAYCFCDENGNSEFFENFQKAMVEEVNKLNKNGNKNQTTNRADSGSR